LPDGNTALSMAKSAGHGEVIAAFRGREPE
jgi:hypothetical protein